MREAFFAAIFFFLSSVGLLGQAHDKVSRHTEAAAGTTAQDMIRHTVSTIHARLSEVMDKYPQLSDLADARLSDTGLDYEKGEISWPKGKMSGAKFSVKDGCRLRLVVSYPVEGSITQAAADQGGYDAHAKLSWSFFLSSDWGNPDHDAFEKVVRGIVREEIRMIAAQFGRQRLEQVCRTLREKTGGEWEIGAHNAWLPSVFVIRGRVRDAAGKTTAQYDVLPIRRRDDPYARKALALYAPARTEVSILGLGRFYTVVERLQGRADETVEKTRVALVEALELSPPKITVDMYRPVLAAAKRALDKAQRKARPEIAGADRRTIAVGHAPYIEERDGVLRYVWEWPTSSKTGYRIVVEQAQDGKVSVLETELGF